MWCQISKDNNFRVFADELQAVKIVLRHFWRCSQLNVIHSIARHHTTGSMALLHYYSKASEVEKLADPLAKGIPSAISSANTEVQRVLQLQVDSLTT